MRYRTISPWALLVIATSLAIYLWMSETYGRLRRWWTSTRIYFYVTRHKTDPFYACPDCHVMPGHAHEKQCIVPTLTRSSDLIWSGEWNVIREEVTS